MPKVQTPWSSETLQEVLLRIEASLAELNGKFETALNESRKDRGDLNIRVTRLEERYSFIQKIVYGAIGIVITIETLTIVYFLQKIGGSSA